MKKKLSVLMLIAWLPYLSVSLLGQSLVIGKVRDGFLKIPLPEARVSLLLAKDSSVVVDSVPIQKIRRNDGTLSSAQFMLNMKKETCKYLLHATLEGYEDAWMPLNIDGGNEGAWMLDEALELRKIKENKLSTAVVTATRGKMYYKGDTLVYNADAFKLPDGSMLDELIRQMPGVTMNEEGEIFVNGRKVDELLLGSRSFMNGNKKVLLQNLPYFTVKDIKIYDKRSDLSEAFGRDVDARKYVMDVNLKKEYSRGYIANMEAAGGTSHRWLGRGFLLGFTDRWRYSIMGNMNNVNETRHVGGDGHWTPATMPRSLLTTRSVATNLNYHSEERKLTNDFTADFTCSDSRSEMRQRHEQFFEGGYSTSRTETSNEADNWNLKLQNNLRMLKPGYLNFITQFDYEKRNGTGLSQFKQWDEELTASMRTDALSEGRGWSVSQQAIAAFDKEKWYTNAFFFFRHSDDQSWLSNRFKTWQTSTSTQDVRYNASDVSNRLTNASLSNLWRFGNLFGKTDMSVKEGVDYFESRTHDYLYHPDTLLLASQLDLLHAITDPSNSYDSHVRKWGNTIGLSFSQTGHEGYTLYTRWEVGLDIPVLHHTVDYQRGAVDTLMNDTWVYFLPYAAYRYKSPGSKHQLEVRADFKCEPVDLVSQIAYRDNSNPLVVKLGNPALKGRSTTHIYADYTRKIGKKSSQWHIGANGNFRHRDVAQSTTYDPQSGVHTYKPTNVCGAYDLKGQFDISSHLDKNRYWTWQMNADANYNHSIDHSVLSGENASRRNTVNTLTLHDGLYVQFQKKALSIRANGDVSWRNSEGKMRDFETLNAVDLQYGLSARYTLPTVKTTLAAHGTMYMRRGYGSAQLNTDDFVLNASLSQPFMKGKLIFRVEAFDLLHQLSSTQYEVNAQGRTETWYRSLPHYVMGHLVYHFNRNPKK